VLDFVKDALHKRSAERRGETTRSAKRAPSRRFSNDTELSLKYNILPMLRPRFSYLPLLVVAQLVVGCARTSAPPQLDGPSAPARLRTEPWAYGERPGQKVRSQHYLLLTTIDDPDVVDALGQVMEGALTQYRRVAPAPPAKSQPMECYLFQYRNEWANFTQKHTGADAPIYLQINRGGYTFGDKYVAFFIGDLQTYSVAAHEGWHQYVARHFKHRPPPFLEEGLACMFEQVKWEGNLPRWDLSSNNSRIRGLRNGLGTKTLLPLRQLISMHAGQVVDQTTFQVETFYAQNWAFARFLWDAEEGRYRPALQQLLADAAAGTLYRDGIPREPGSTEWDPTSAGPLLERYIGMPLPMIDRAYRAYIRKLVSGHGGRVAGVGTFGDNGAH
jgi:hypothetical protein